MIRSFRDAGAEDIFNGANHVPRDTPVQSRLWKVAFRKLDQLDSISFFQILVYRLAISLSP